MPVGRGPLRGDSQICLHILPYVSWGQKSAQLKMTLSTLFFCSYLLHSVSYRALLILFPEYLSEISSFLFFFFFLFLLGHTYGSSQPGSNPSHTHDNVGSLTHWATRELLVFVFFVLVELALVLLSCLNYFSSTKNTTCPEYLTCFTCICI